MKHFLLSLSIIRRWLSSTAYKLSINVLIWLKNEVTETRESITNAGDVKHTVLSE